MLDALRGYVELASGLTEVTVRKARKVAQSLLSGELDGVVPTGAGATDAARAMSSQVQDLADDIVAQATANRELLVGLIRTEIDRAAGRLGFVREEELAAVRRHLQRLEEQVKDLQKASGSSGSAAAPAAAAKPRAKKKVPAGTRAAATKAAPADAGRTTGGSSE